MVTDGVRCASYLPTDGYLDPSQLTYALAEGARDGRLPGLHPHARDRDRRRRRPGPRRADRVGRVEAEIVVNAGGMFAAEIGRLAGVRVPVVPFAHEYLVTQPFRERNAGEHLPTLRDPDLLIYFREEGAGLVMGGYERHSAPWSLDEHLARPDSAGLQRPPARGGLAALRGDRRATRPGASRRWRTSRSRG